MKKTATPRIEMTSAFGPTLHNCGASKCWPLGEQRKSLKRAQTDVTDPVRAFSAIRTRRWVRRRQRANGSGAFEQVNYTLRRRFTEK
jgi:hypothetical protein